MYSFLRLVTVVSLTITGIHMYYWYMCLCFCAIDWDDSRMKKWRVWLGRVRCRLSFVPQPPAHWILNASPLSYLLLPLPAFCLLIRRRWRLWRGRGRERGRTLASGLRLGHCARCPPLDSLCGAHAEPVAPQPAVDATAVGDVRWLHESVTLVVENGALVHLLPLAACVISCHQPTLHSFLYSQVTLNFLKRQRQNSARGTSARIGIK